MFEWLPPGVELVLDVSVADWILSKLEPWASAPARLASFMPDGFQAYARVLHPFEYPHPGAASTWRTWAEFGSERGVVITPDISFDEVAEDFRDFSYAEGKQPTELCARLASVLATRTSTPENCWYCIWAGEMNTGIPFVREGTPRKVIRRLHKEARREDRLLDSVPKVKAGQGRDYFLLRGPVHAASSLRPWNPHMPLPPRIWWPDDRAWIVVTEIDGFSTYVGSDRATIDEVLASDLETIEVTRDARMD